MKVFASLGMMMLLATVGGCDSSSAKDKDGNPTSVELLNVSYDPTRELWRALNEKFIPAYAKTDPATQVTIKQSHGGSSAQARSVVEGLEADVVTLALWTDTDAIRKAGLIDEGWQQRLPHNSLPYYSTIVFVVRKGNEKQIHDWPDLVKPDIKIVTPSPKTSGNGKLSFLAAWGSVITRGGTVDDAREFVTKIYHQTPVLDTGARGSTITFAEKKIGDVHLTWENEAYLEVAESKGELEIVYPSTSIKAEPFVAVVDANVKHKGTAKVAEAYLKFLYTPEAQRVIGEHYYRPIDDDVAKEFSSSLKDIKLFKISDFSPGWAEAQQQFFAEGGVFDKIYSPQ